jgi:tetratricopeptide (TPR) repeat protein
MRNGLKFVPAIANVLLLSLFAMPLTTASVLAADQPTVSNKLAKPLKAAQDAMAAKNYDEAMSKIKEAQALPEKTPYDNWVINTFLLKVYAAKSDMASEVPVIETLAQSQYTTPDQKKIYLKSVAQYYYQTKDYNKALETANEAVKAGASDNDVMGLIARSQYLTGKYKDAAATMSEIVGKQEKPDEDSLKLLWQFCDKAGDKAGAAKAVEKLVAYYPKPEYWANALASLANADTKDAHLQLNVYRLMLDVGVLKRGIDYSDMAELSLDQGYPGETQSVLQRAFSENVYSEQRDKDRYQHLLDGAKQRAAADQASLPKQEQDATAAPQGDKLVQVGAAYMSYGQNDKAVAAITKGIAKGSLKYPDEANLLLGIAQLRSHNAGDAQRSFEKVGGSSNPGYARLGKLWALHAGAKSV